MGDVVNRKENPMVFKKKLAGMIVTDFHAAEAATKAGEDWARQFQKDEVPSDAPRVTVKLEKIAVVGGGPEVQQEGSTHFPLWNIQMERDRQLDPQKIKAVRLDKMIFEAGFVDSRTEAGRKIRAKAVRVMDRVIPVTILSVIVPCDLPTTLGRQSKIVSIIE
jgi:tyrosyl-tRNA synthetase